MVRRSLHRRVGGPLCRLWHLVGRGPSFHVAPSGPISWPIFAGLFSRFLWLGPSSEIGRGGTLGLTCENLAESAPLLKKCFVDEWLPSHTRARDFLGVGGGGVPENEAREAISRMGRPALLPVWLDAADPPSDARAFSSVYDAYLPVAALLLCDRCVLRSIHRSSSTRGKRTVRPRRVAGILASSRAQRCTVREET